MAGDPFAGGHKSLLGLGLVQPGMGVLLFFCDVVLCRLCCFFFAVFVGFAASPSLLSLGSYCSSTISFRTFISCLKGLNLFSRTTSSAAIVAYSPPATSLALTQWISPASGSLTPAVKGAAGRCNEITLRNSGPE